VFKSLNSRSLKTIFNIEHEKTILRNAKCVWKRVHERTDFVRIYFLTYFFFPINIKLLTHTQWEKTSFRLRLDWGVNSQKNKEQWTSAWSVGPIEQVDESAVWKLPHLTVC